MCLCWDQGLSINTFTTCLNWTCRHPSNNQHMWGGNLLLSEHDHLAITREFTWMLTKKYLLNKCVCIPNRIFLMRLPETPIVRVLQGGYASKKYRNALLCVHVCLLHPASVSRFSLFTTTQYASTSIRRFFKGPVPLVSLCSTCQREKV